VKYKCQKTSKGLKNVLINDKSQGNITKHLMCYLLLYFKNITQLASERIFEIGEHLVKLRTKWLIV